MPLYQALILSFIQGVTEFLPISSSGHLVFFQKLMGFKKPPVFFDILIHFATLFSILFYFRRQLFFFRNRRFIFLVIAATLPAVFLGFLLEPYLESIFNSFFFLGLFWLVNAALLFSTKLIKDHSQQIKQLKNSNALIIGLFQAAALFPGVSRSGATIVGGLWQKLSALNAFLFSFFLAIPALLGAATLEILKKSPTQLPDFLTCFFSFILTAVSGYFSLSLLKKTLQKGNFFYFSFYCFVLGLVSLVFGLIFH